MTDQVKTEIPATASRILLVLADNDDAAIAIALAHIPASIWHSHHIHADRKLSPALCRDFPHLLFAQDSQAHALLRFDIIWPISTLQSLHNDAPAPPSCLDVTGAKEALEACQFAKSNIAACTLLADDPGNLRTAVIWSLGLLSVQSDIRAREVLENIVPDPDSKQTLLARRLGLLGHAYIRAQEYEKARNMLGESICAGGMTKDTLFALALAYRKLRDYPMAEKCYQKMLKLNPEWPEAIFGFASCRAKMGASDSEVLDLFAQAYAINTKGDVVPYGVCSYLYNKNRLADSLRFLRKVLADNGEDPDNLAVSLRASAPKFIVDLRTLQAMCAMQMGDLVRGWQLLEWRRTSSLFGMQTHCSRPSWDGSPLHGKQLLIHWEKGVGD
ncbi:MAG: tetratricopeptide repeat protein, partial [Pseudomonadota bacterium]